MYLLKFNGYTVIKEDKNRKVNNEIETYKIKWVKNNVYRPKSEINREKI